MSTKTLLLINQDEDTVRICTEFFQDRGYRVLAADDTDAGLRTAGAEPPCLIMTELHVRTPTGWRVLERLKHEPATAGVPVIALTANALEEDRRRAALADCFVAKPADLWDLLEAVQRFAAGGGEGRAAPGSA